MVCSPRPSPPRLLMPLLPLVWFAWSAAVAAANLVPAPDNGGITLPSGFRAVVVADGVTGVRGLAVAANGDLYARQQRGGVVALRDTDGDGVADERVEIPTAAGGSGIGLHGGYLYYSTDSGIVRLAREPDALVPAGPAEVVVAGLPDERQHAAKMFTFDGDGQLYVEVGSPSNALGVPDRARGASGMSDEEVARFLSRHGGIWRFDPNRLGQTQADGLHWSTGHRHVLSLAWHPVSRELFAAQNGRDVIDVVKPEVFNEDFNRERVAEEFHRLTQGADLGWPRTFYDPRTKRRLYSPEYDGDGRKGPPAGRYAEPLIAFPAHWAPMQMVHYAGESFPAEYRGGMFLAFHGSWNRAPDQRGYNVVFIPFDAEGRPTGQWRIFADGFMGRGSIASPRDAAHRPMGLAVGPDGSLYIGSDHSGRIWRVFHAGE